jgi:putative proteasome-type protease
MTYCLAISVDDGLVFASDSRTNAGVDYVTSYSKMHTFVWPNERLCVLLTSGNLATSQAVMNTIRADLEDESSVFNLRSGNYLHEVAHYIGKLSQKEQCQHKEAMEGSNNNAECSFILGGQLQGQASEIYLIYPQGNYISASPETPYLQIGENKYGKPILDRIITTDTSLEDAARCALVSLDSTIRSNVSVGPPLELAVHKDSEIKQPFYSKLTFSSPMYKEMRKQWNKGLREAFDQLPRFDWEETKKD